MAAAGFEIGVSESTPSYMSSLARTLYADGPVVARKLQHWRPYICPFDRLVRHVHHGSMVLDVGCGSGLLFALMAGLGLEFEGIGLDASPRPIELAKRMATRASEKGLRAKLFFQLLSEGSWPTGTFDTVFLVDVLHHIPATDQRSFFDQVLSKVRPGGTFVYKDMCLHPWWKAQANTFHDLIIAGELINYVPVEAVEEWATTRGFDVILREDVGRFWYGHELRVLKRADHWQEGAA